jgi:hypothetical protein
VRKITFFAASLSLSLMVLGGAFPQTASAGDDHIVKVACSTGDGRVIGADTSSVPEEVPLLCSPCSPGNQCVECLNALISNGCGFDKDLDALYIETPVGPAVLYHLFDEDGDCIEDVCEQDSPS